MRLVYSITNIENSGGIERVLSTKANYFADILGYEVHIIVLESFKKPFFSFSDKIQIHSLDIDQLNHKPWMIFGSRSRKEYQQKLFQKLDEIRPDVTISVFGPDAEFLYKAKDGSKKVLEFHFTKNYLKHLGNALVDDKFRWIRKAWLWFLLKKESFYALKYDHIVLLTEKDKQLWGGAAKFEVIPNLLSYISEKTASLDSKQIISMGRIVRPKGFHYLLQAFEILHKKYPDWKVVIYGDGHDKGPLQKEINKLSLQDYFMINPPVSDVESVMLKASLFVLTSLYDGFGLVLAEAMTCGLPCVSFDCECGPSEIIKDGEDGFLVETRNVLALVERMEQLMDDRQLRIRMGAVAKKNVKRFDAPVVMNKWVEYLNRIVGKY